MVLLLGMTIYSCYRLHRSMSNLASNNDLSETDRLNRRVNEDATLLTSALLLDLMWFLI